MQFLTNGYEESICPKGIDNAGRASYIERNQAMISESDICVFCFDENYLPQQRKNRKNKGGTAIAFRYTQSKKKIIINCFHI